MTYVHAGQGLGEAGTIQSEAAEWVRERWDEFVALEPKIVDLQHRAAVLGAQRKDAGDLQGHAAAVAMIRELGTLNQLHGKLVDRFHELAPYVGLGAIALPVAVATAFSALAIAVLWFFRKVSLQEELLEELEAGTLSEEGYIAAQRALGEMPGPMGEATNLARWIVLGVLGFFALQAFQTFRQNPPLTVWENPPEDLLSTRAWSLAYRHLEDGLDYQHDFGPGVRVETLPNGDVLLWHPEHRLWREF